MSLLIFTSYHCEAQADSIASSLQQLPDKYITRIDNKIDKYSNRITSKTEKTLARLSRWENKIQSLLQKVNPDAAQRLFGNTQTTFKSLFQKVKEGKSIAENYKAQYNDYRDKLTTSLKYLEQQKDKSKNDIAQPLSKATKKMSELEQDVKNSEALEQFIKERKKQLINESVKYIGNSKYLTKINKEAYYYVESLRNYKEIFSEKKKTEEAAMKLLNKIPAFNKFVQNNGMLASIFKIPGNGTSINSPSAPALAGLQTRANVNTLIQNQIAVGGPNAINQVREQIQSGQAQLGILKDKIAKYGSADTEIPSFKPNNQKTKTFSQRITYEANIQFGKANNFLPAQSELAFGVGYKLNDKSVIGIATSIKIGLGTSWNNIKITAQGLGLRSYFDWKIKGNFYASGGYEQNYNSQFKNIQQLKNYAAWQTSGLIGISKKIKSRGNKSAKFQLFYDFLSYRHVPVTQPFIFRTGFSFK